MARATPHSPVKSAAESSSIIVVSSKATTESVTRTRGDKSIDWEILVWWDTTNWEPLSHPTHSVVVVIHLSWLQGGCGDNRGNRMESAPLLLILLGDSSLLVISTGEHSGRCFANRLRVVTSRSGGGDCSDL